MQDNLPQNQLFAFTCFVKPLQSWKTTHSFAKTGCNTVFVNLRISIPQNVQSRGMGIGSWLLYLTMLTACSHWEWVILVELRSCLIWINFSHSQQWVLHGRVTSPNISPPAASHSQFLLKLLPRYWTKIILCDLITQRQAWDRQNRLRRLVLVLWQTSYGCLINNIITANHLVVPTSTHFLGDTRACDRGEWLYHVCLR